MSERIDHAAEAVELTGAEWRNGEVAVAQLVEAQVHATLALVEQQRIANLIAYSQVFAIECLSTPNLEFDQESMLEKLARVQSATSDVWAALGLKESQ